MCRLILWIVLASVLLGVAGCQVFSSTTDHTVPVAVSLKGTRLETTALVEALLAEKGTRIEAVNASYKDEAFQAQCVFKSDGEKLNVVFLAPQMRLLTILVTKPHRVWCEKAPQIPQLFEPEYALVDLAFINLPLPKLRAAIGPTLKVDESNGVRRICRVRDGGLVAELAPAEGGMRRYRQVLFGYEYLLKEVMP